MFVEKKNQFRLPRSVQSTLHSFTPKFGFDGFGELVYFRTYSRLKEDGSQEKWADTVIRVIEGVFTIRKDHFAKRHLPWDEVHHQHLAESMAIAMFHMRWLPPGRGLWAMGTDYVFTRGSACLQNCGATKSANLVESASWAMDMLMCGVGIGWDTSWSGIVNRNLSSDLEEYAIPDTREGWVESVRRLLAYYIEGAYQPLFGYHLIREAGEPIHGFGGTASGPEPLKKLHARLHQIMQDYHAGKQGTTRTIADVFNSIGACVVAGNVRRSAEIALGDPEDDTFLNLKNYVRFPDRQDIGWLSNNSVVLRRTQDFESLPKLAERIRDNGEPGLINLLNVQRYGRLGEEKPDQAELFNPCAEQPLEDKELCTLVEVFPSRCADKREFLQALEYATWYASTVTLLPTHDERTNSVMQRNRRIGVSISGVTELLQRFNASGLTRALRDGYKVVEQTNTHLAKEAGIPASVRLTTIKPSGSISQLVGCSPGAHFPTFPYAIRRIRVGDDTPIGKFLKAQGITSEPDTFSENTSVFSFPIRCDNARPAKEVSAWEQFALLAMLQREWSDNAVSQTIYFDPATEGPQVEHMLAQFAPLVKSVSLLPHSEKGAYPQMPYEGISLDEYTDLSGKQEPINWASFTGSDGSDSRFCTNDSCEI